MSTTDKNDIDKGITSYYYSQNKTKKEMCVTTKN
jgi:hypothetical protein